MINIDTVQTQDVQPQDVQPQNVKVNGPNNINDELFILNNLLKWDGTHLGSHVNAITHQWSLEGIRYYGITLSMDAVHILTEFEGTNYISQGAGHERKVTYQSETNKSVPTIGTIFCTALCTKDVFPCIVEDIKVIFGLPRRGVHRIIIDNKDYILYYVPITIEGRVIWETPLSRLDTKHLLRKDPNFRKEVQKIIAFCDILALCNTGEAMIRIRPGTNAGYVPISINETSTAISKGNDYSIITKTLFSKWFGEETSLNDIVKEMVNYRTRTPPQCFQIPNIEGKEPITNNLAVVTADIRNKVDNVIKLYNNNYIWYSYFIVDRMSRFLLTD